MAQGDQDTMEAWERTVERLFRPGTFIPERACEDFISDLEEVEAEVAKGMADQPERAITRYETLLAGCYEKTCEMDDSGGHMTGFVERLFCGWAQARQAGQAEPGQTARWLLDRMEQDPHGHCLHLEREVAQVLGEREKVAFLRGIEARAGAEEGGCIRDPGAAPQRWVEALREVHRAWDMLASTIALAESTGIRSRDCEEIAEMLVAREQLPEALAWVERGLALEKKDGGGYGLESLRRELLVRLGRGDEALQSAWARFEAYPHCFTFEPLADLIPESEAQAWRGRILEVVGRARLEERMDLLLVLEEVDLLGQLVEQTSDEDLEGLSHTRGEPAATLLQDGHPGLSARLWRAQALRILHARRSRYYEVAVLDLAHARDGFLAAGQDEEWERTASQLRVEHKRKLGFMEGFERLLAGAPAIRQPTFLERAKATWQKDWQA